MALFALKQPEKARRAAEQLDLISQFLGQPLLEQLDRVELQSLHKLRGDAAAMARA